MNHINLKTATRVVGIFVALTFVALFALTFSIGGEAGNGKIVGGHFFLANHGQYVETTEAHFRVSLFLVRLFLFSFLALVALGIGIKIQERYRSRTGT